MKKHFAILLSMLLIVCLCANAFAEETGDSPNRLSSAFAGFAGRAGDAIATWAEGAANDFTDWVNDPENGLQAWTEKAAGNIQKWIQGAADDASAFFEQAGLGLDEWLKQTSQFFANAGNEISKAWETLTHNSNVEEVQEAYDTLKAWMDANDVEESIREAVDGIAKAAGVQLNP